MARDKSAKKKEAKRGRGQLKCLFHDPLKEYCACAVPVKEKYFKQSLADGEYALVDKLDAAIKMEQRNYEINPFMFSDSPERIAKMERMRAKL